MTPSQTDLLRSLEEFSFDEAGATLTFAQRLARENGWSAEFTRKALQEYRRFLFLAMCAGHPVCPSEAVDQVWHLHLIYTRSYWDRLCGEVLRQPLHHGPTKGGGAEGKKHHSMYEDTLSSYRRFFGADAPEDVWPPAAQRFREGTQFVRLHRPSFWIIPKPSWLKWLGVSPVFLLGGCENGGGSPMDYSGPAFLAFYFFFAVTVYIALAIWKATVRRGGVLWVRQAADLTDPYETAVLVSGRDAAVRAALCELVRVGLVSVAGNQSISRIQGAEVPTYLHPLEVEILNRMPSSIASLRELRAVADPAVRRIERSLEDRGLIVGAERRRSIQHWCTMIAGFVALMGVGKILVGLGRDKPVLYVTLLTIIAIVMVVRMRRLPYRTLAGDRMLRKLRQDHPRETYTAAQLGDRSVMAGYLPMAVALYGTGILYGSSLEHMDPALFDEIARKEARQSSGCGTSGCSSGCGSDSSSGGDSGGGGGGDGGGSGCGGCGGGGGD